VVTWQRSVWCCAPIYHPLPRVSLTRCAPLMLQCAAGSGKTVLSSTIIDALKREPSGKLAFFYFSIQKEPVSLLKLKCSLLTQLLKCLIKPSNQIPGWHEVPVPYVQLYRKYRPSNEPSMEDLDQVMLSLLELSGQAFIVLDALDECVPQGLRGSVIAFLETMLRLDRGKTHVLVTSRREPDIEELISTLRVPKQLIPVSVAEINRDIRQHLETFMKTELFRKWSVGLKAEVLDHLTKNAEGVFRWADLQIHSLTSQEREKDVRKALKRLPKDLETTYQRILLRIEEEDKFEEAFAILRWLAYSTRVLSLSEAAELAAFEVDDTDIAPESPDFSVSFHPANRFMEASAILRLLSGLVTVSGNASQPEDVDIYFAHSSVQDYLLSNGVSPSRFRLDFAGSNWFILKSCMAYASHYDNADMSEQKQPPYPLLGYACERAGQHLVTLLPQATEKYDSIDTIASYGRNKGRASTLQLRCMARELGKLPPENIVFIDSGFVGVITGPPYPPLKFHFDEFRAALLTAAAAGESDLTEVVLDASAKRPLPGETTALHAAAFKRPYAPWLAQMVSPNAVQNYPAVVRTLVAAGHRANATTIDGRTPLHLAAAIGHVEVATTLLEFPDVDINASDFRDQTPLIIAAARGHHDLLNMLLSVENVQLNRCDEEDRTALSWAAAGLNNDIVERLLGHDGIDVNKADCRGRTPLIWASSMGRKETVKCLLAVPGIHLDAKDFLGRTALSYAALRGYQDIVSMLRGRSDVTPDPVDTEDRHLTDLIASRGHNFKHRPVTSSSVENKKETVGKMEWVGDTESTATTSGLTWSDTSSSTSFSTVESNRTLGPAVAGSSEPTKRLRFNAMELGYHGREVWHIRFSNDGRRLAACGEFTSVAIWDVRSRTAMLTLKGHEDSVTHLAWSGDDNLLLSTCFDCRARLWDADVSCPASPFYVTKPAGANVYPRTVPCLERNTS